MRRSSGFGGRPRPLVIALAAFSIAVSATTRARADEERSIVVLLEPEQPNDAAKETITRAKNELLAAGFDVQLSRERGTDTRKALTTAMTEAHAVAAIAIEPAPGSSIVEVWVNDGLTGKLSIRPVETRGQGDTPALLAVRAVELLRASLIELTSPPRGAPAVEAPAPAKRLVEGEPRVVSFRSGLAIEAGATATLVTSPLRPEIAPMIAISYGSDMGLGGRLRWSGPTAGPDLEGALGHATLTEELLLAECVYAPPLDVPVSIFGTAGLGMLHAGASGELADPSRERSGGATVLATSLGLGLDVRLDNHFGLGAEVFGAITAPAIVIDMGDETLGTIGRPLLGIDFAAIGVF